MDYVKLIAGLEKEAINLYKNESMKWFLERIRRLVGGKSKEATKEDDHDHGGHDDNKDDGDEQIEKGSRTDIAKQHAMKMTAYVYRPMIGSMCLYTYDPKWKRTLPYYDTFPCTFPIEIYDDGFLGLNMHYLPPFERAQLFTALHSRINRRSQDVNEKSFFKINYDIISGYSQFKNAKPCIKRYLTGHVRSRVYVINPLHWKHVLFLPLANFQKASEAKVWADSLRKIKGI